MNILLIGSGGREHALAWKLAQSPICDTLYAAPGNPGIAGEAKLAAVDVSDHAAVAAFCFARAIGLVVIGPEAPLVDGLADTLRKAGFPVFGPSAAAAQLEGSKAFTKRLCARAKIPTAAFRCCDTREKALAALSDFSFPVVVKADGLAAGKGVVIAETLEEARSAIDAMFGGTFGDAGAAVVVEEFMTGEEASFFALTDGASIVPFGSAQDHKRVGDGDTGPNTGGMGAYSPASVFTAELEAQVLEQIVGPTVRTMAMDGTPFSGVLFVGLMLTPTGPKLIEYNCRFGDPECQVLMMRFAGDLAVLLYAIAKGELETAPIPKFLDTAALTVVFAAQGYPELPKRGAKIEIGDVGEARVFHAGTAMIGGDLVANGGRVLNVSAMANSITDARALAYAAVGKISFPGGFCRQDIGWREEERERAD